MDRRLIWIGVGVLAAVAIVLVIKIRSGDSAAAGSNSTTSDPVGDSRPGDSATRKKPTLPEQPAADPTSADTFTEMEVDGVRIRDHRKNASGSFKMPDDTRHHDHTKLPKPLVYDVSAKLQAVMAECAQIPAESRGAKPRIEGTVFVDVKSGTLEIKEAGVKISDVEGDTSKIKDCFEQKSVGQTVPSGTFEDTARYPITIVLTIPK